MNRLVLAAMLTLGASGAWAQSAIPDMKGTWTGNAKVVVIGSNPYHPGSATLNSPPRVAELAVTFNIEGQDGRLVWGRFSSSVPGASEPFGWAMSADGRTMIGSDTDGSHFVTLQSADLMEVCYTQTGAGPSKSIVASCFMATRKR